MPSLFRFVIILASITGITYGTMYILATQFEPEQEVVHKRLYGVKVKPE